MTDPTTPPSEPNDNSENEEVVHVQPLVLRAAAAMLDGARVGYTAQNDQIQAHLRDLAAWHARLVVRSGDRHRGVVVGRAGRCGQ